MSYAELHQGMGVAIGVAITAILIATYLGVELCRADRKIGMLTKRQNKGTNRDSLS